MSSLTPSCPFSCFPRSYIKSTRIEGLFTLWPMLGHASIGFQTTFISPLILQFHYPCSLISSLKPTAASGTPIPALFTSWRGIWMELAHVLPPCMTSSCTVGTHLPGLATLQSGPASVPEHSTTTSVFILVVLVYLLHLCRSDLAHSSVQIYLAALSAFLPPVDGFSIFMHPPTALFLHGLLNIFPSVGKTDPLLECQPCSLHPH